MDSHGQRNQRMGTNGANIYYTSGSGNVGVGTATPAVKMDINGSIRFGNAGLTCSGGSNKGVLRFNTAESSIEFCNGTAWVSAAGPAVSSCATQIFTGPGEYNYKVLAGCQTVMIEAYGAGGGGAYNNDGGGGGGSSRVENAGGTILALGGGGAYQPYFGFHGSGGGGGYGKKIITLTTGDNLKVIVGQGGQNGCSNYAGAGGNPNGGTSGTNSNGGASTFGGSGGGDYNYRGGNSTHGGVGGASNTSNASISTTNGGAGGSGIVSSGCSTTTTGGLCGHLAEGGGGGGGLGDIVLPGLAGDDVAGGYAANGGPGIGAVGGVGCPTRGGNGQVTIRPMI